MGQESVEGAEAGGQTPVTAAGPAADAPVGPGTILIIDPDADVLQSTGMLIESMGYRVLQLAESDDILEVVDREQPDLVLLEVKMQDLNVAGLLAALRSSPRTSRIPVAFFSASFELASIAARHQAWGHLSKPFGYHELSHLLERALGPPPGKTGSQDAREVEKEVRAAFREYRNLLAAVNNYVTVLDKFEALDPHAKSAVSRVGDLVLMLEARTERLRSYILALLGPIEPTPRGPRPRDGADHGSVRTSKRINAEPEPSSRRASSPPPQTVEERRQAARERLLGGRVRFQ
ncbi:MAG: two-component system, NtrC family, response regulator GlrR [Thermoplasmata archaeon]|jgi:CheY-like chemotaxis protein|nr:two-component system, NtrC family, response regulator GlrR [Thermoplasmata archaeon]